MIVVIIQVKVVNNRRKTITIEYLDEENCECRCMPGTFRCNSGPCLPMVRVLFRQEIIITFYRSRDCVVMVFGNVMMVVMN